jgi:hypothetical protein
MQNGRITEQFDREASKAKQQKNISRTACITEHQDKREPQQKAAKQPNTTLANEPRTKIVKGKPPTKEHTLTTNDANPKH